MRRERLDIGLAEKGDPPLLRSTGAQSVDATGPTACTPARAAAWKALAGEAGFEHLVFGVNNSVAVPFFHP